MKMIIYSDPILAEKLESLAKDELTSFVYNPFGGEGGLEGYVQIATLNTNSQGEIEINLEKVEVQDGGEQ